MKLQNRQAASHKAKNYLLFLLEIKNQDSEKFTDTQIYKKLSFSSLNTVRKIRKDLVKLEILQKIDEIFPNNQKFYKIKNQKKLSKLFYEYSQKLSERTYGEILNKKSITYFGKYGKLIQIKYHFKHLKHNTHYYPKSFFIKKICPMCQGKLRNFKSTYGNLSRKCMRCKFTFYDGSIILACEKPLAVKQPLRVRPWHENYGLKRQKALAKMVSKILRES